MKVCGIDYSMTSPAMCVYDTETNQLSFYYMTTTKSREHIAIGLIGQYHDYDNNVTTDIRDKKVGSSITRFSTIADFFLGIIREQGIDMVYLEGYSLGSKGKVFSIAENTAILKYRLWRQGVQVRIFAPTTIKKYATGKGNANKELMKESFEQHTEVAQILSPLSQYKDSPYTDCVDAYWIMKYGLTDNT